MNVLLVSANVEQISMAALPLGLAHVAEATRQAGHDVVFVDLMLEADPRGVLEKAVAGFRPDVIGLSVRNIDDQVMEPARFLLDQAKDAVAVCRGLSDAPIVLGGAGYSIFPERVLEYLEADMGIQGEGEAAFPALLEALAEGGDLSEIPALYLPGRGGGRKRAFAKELHGAPFPDVGLLAPSARKSDEMWIPIQTRRGCPLNCSYCSTPVIEGATIRAHAPESVVNWIGQWVNAGFKQFFFVDNIFNLPVSYAKDLCRKLIGSGMDIAWISIVYPKDVDEELVALMAQAGCRQVALGFESGCSRILKNLNKTFETGDVRRISDLFAEHGVQRGGFLLLGSPGETMESVEESFDFADSLNLDLLKVTTGVRIYPDTPLAKRAFEEGVIPGQCDLLQPHFYLAKGLEDWLPKTAKEWKASRPYPVA